mmetsp:Transcript_9282/g.23035  ORF Transcript_9282/g.23035 Transcript_9282/m.23035 type:complete len:241 (-) Transcript_9282:245-967(-)
MIRAEALQELRLLVVSARGDHVITGQLRELHGKLASTSRGGGDQDSLLGSHAGLLQRDGGSETRGEHGHNFRPSLRHSDHMLRLVHPVLREGTVLHASNRHADRQAHALALGHDDAHTFESGVEGQHGLCSFCTEVAACGKVHVARVDPGPQALHDDATRGNVRGKVAGHDLHGLPEVVAQPHHLHLLEGPGQALLVRRRRVVGPRGAPLRLFLEVVGRHLRLPHREERRPAWTNRRLHS